MVINIVERCFLLNGQKMTTSSLTWAKPSPSWPDSLSDSWRFLEVPGSHRGHRGRPSFSWRPGGHRRPHGRFPFPRQVAVFRRVPGDHRRHHGLLAFPREVTVAIMAGYPLLVELEDVKESPSPSWPVSLPQTSCGLARLLQSRCGPWADVHDEVEIVMLWFSTKGSTSRSTL